MIQKDLYFSAWSRSRLFLPGADPIRLKPEFRDLGLPEAGAAQKSGGSATFEYSSII